MRLLGKGDGRLQERVDEAFVFSPLAAQNHRDAQAERHNCCDQGAPPEQGNHPDPPGDGGAGGEPFEQIGEGEARIPGSQPERNMIEKVNVPLVLRGGMVEGSGQHADEDAGQTVGRDEGADQTHAKDNKHLAGGERPLPAQSGQDRIDNEDNEREKRDKRDGKLGYIDP